MHFQNKKINKRTADSFCLLLRSQNVYSTKKDERKLYKRGFSFVEIIVTIAILSVGLLSVMGMYASGLRDIVFIRSQATANTLAQDGLELVRNVAENSDDWDTSLAPGKDYIATVNITNWNLGYAAEMGGGNSDEYVDMGVIQSGSSYKMYFVDIAAAVHGYNHEGGGVLTRFSRRVFVENKNFDGEGEAIFNDREITSLVTWNSTDPPNSISACSASSKCIYATMKLVRKAP